MSKFMKVAVAEEVAEGEAVKFSFLRGGKILHGFLSRFQGQLVAYENRCRHLPVTLDYESGKFFERGGSHFICQAHGAMYEPLTGLCVRGPCEGESLQPLKFEIMDGAVWVADASAI